MFRYDVFTAIEIIDVETGNVVEGYDVSMIAEVYDEGEARDIADKAATTYSSIMRCERDLEG